MSKFGSKVGNKRPHKPINALKKSVSKEDLAWLAGFLDGEGWFGIVKNGDQYIARVEVCNTHMGGIDKISNMFTEGVLERNHHVNRKRELKHKPVKRIRFSQRILLNLLNDLREFLVVKSKQTEILMEFLVTRYNHPYGTLKDSLIFEILANQIKPLNARGIS